jgi:DNA-binding NarL/FixJ family response regulator
MDGRTQRETIQLTPREHDIIEFLLLGCDITEIGKNLNIAPRTVKAHLTRIYLRFGIIGGVKRVKLANLLLSEPLKDDCVHESFTRNERERLLIELVSQGLNNREMAAVLGISAQVVKNKLRLIYDRLGLWNRLELALWYKGQQGHELVN